MRWSVPFKRRARLSMAERGMDRTGTHAPMPEVSELAPQVRDFFASLQEEIRTTLERTDGTGVFSSEQWERPGGGGGT